MFKQIILPVAGVIIFIFLVGMFYKKIPLINLPGTSPTPQASVTRVITVGDKIVSVEIADTEEKRIKGLSGRVSLDLASGMLFTFGSKGLSPAFWMKDMLFPLDLIWIGGAKVIKIDKSIPLPAKGTPDNRLKIYTAGQPTDYVLEVNGGFSDMNNIQVGDSVDLTNLGK